jgi:hypothetical protein
VARRAVCGNRRDGPNRWCRGQCAPRATPRHSLTPLVIHNRSKGLKKSGSSRQATMAVGLARLCAHSSARLVPVSHNHSSFTIAFSAHKQDCVSLDRGSSFTCNPHAVDSVFDGGIAIDVKSGLGLTGGGELSPALSGWVHRSTDGGSTWSPSRVLQVPFCCRCCFCFLLSWWAAVELVVVVVVVVVGAVSW